MSLKQGPSLPKSLTVDACKATLNQYKAECRVKEVVHRQKFSSFLSEFKVSDPRQLASKYPYPNLQPFIESAYFYYLTLNGSLAIINHGIESIELHFEREPHELDRQFASLNESTLEHAKEKIKCELDLQIFSKNIQVIQKDSPEELHKMKLYKALTDKEMEIKSLTIIERLAIEYYEVVIKADEMLYELELHSCSLDKLTKKLKKSTPITITTTVDDSFGKDFLADDSIFSSSDGDLSTLLSDRLQVKSDDDEDIDWDSLGHSNRSSLTEALPASMPALLQQYERQQSSSAALDSPQASSSVPSTLPRPDH